MTGLKNTSGAAHGEKGDKLGAWSKYVEQVSEVHQGDHGIDRENDPVVFIQVFRGVPECGHWSLLIVDCTVDKLGSLCSWTLYLTCFATPWTCIVQSILSGTPLAPEGCKWICASMPRQGI
jgi:hypothetical protein